MKGCSRLWGWVAGRLANMLRRASALWSMFVAVTFRPSIMPLMSRGMFFVSRSESESARVLQSTSRLLRVPSITLSLPMPAQSLRVGACGTLAEEEFERGLVD
jgi:hypothetical protein